MENMDLTGALHEVVDGLANLPASLTIPLDPPIEHAGGTYNQIVLQEPKADQVRQAEEQLRAGAHIPHNQTNFRMHLVSKVAGVPFAVAQQMGVARLNMAMGYLNLFLAYGRGTGVS
jgi:hypothetical protein